MRKKRWKMPRIMSLVRVSDEANDAYVKQLNGPHPLQGLRLLFLGDIPNMPGHCVLLDHRTNKIHATWHTDSFVELTEEEV